MYELPVVVPDTFSHMDTDVKMYKLPPIQGNTDDIPKGGSGDNLAFLEIRQESILERLQNLKIRVDSLQGSKKAATRSVEHLEIAVHASPAHPPHSLPLVVNYLQSQCGYKLHTTCHVHSSYTKPLPQKLVDFLPVGSTELRSRADVKIALVWKDVGTDPVSVVGLLPNAAVYGEVNLLRFLARLFGLFDFESTNSNSQLCDEDEKLDKIHSELVWGDVVNDKKAVMSRAEALIKKRGVDHKQFALSDILLYSVAKRVFAKPTPLVAKFIDQCDKTASGE